MRKITQSIFLFALLLMFAGVPSVGFADVTDVDFQKAFIELRAARKDFNDAREQENQERIQAGREQNQEKRLQAKQRQGDAEKRKEEHRKVVLLRLIDIQIEHLNRTEERIGRMNNIETTLKTQLNAEIGKSIQKLREERVSVQNASTVEELSALAKEIHERFKSYRDVVRKIVDAIHASRLTKVTAQAEKRAVNVKEKIDELREEGKDTSEIEEDLDNAEKKIDDTKEKAERRDFRNANEDLKDAYRQFRKVVDTAKEMD